MQRRGPSVSVMLLLGAFTTATVLGACGAEADTNSDSSPAIESVDDLNNLASRANLAIYDCAKSQGLTVELTPDGAVVPNASSEEADILGDCAGDVLNDPDFVEIANPSESTLRVTFDQSLELYECMEAAGFEPSIPPASFEAWLAEGSIWHPHTEYAESGRFDELDQILAQCPA